MYGESEDVVGKWLAANPTARASIFLATKFGMQFPSHTIDSSPSYCRAALARSLARLGTPYVDLYYVHRLDKITPIEATMRVLAEFQAQGQIRHIGLSECSAASLRRAHAVAPIAAIQVEFNPLCTEIADPKYNLLQTARELGVAVVVCSPLARGLFSGGIKTAADVGGPGDLRVPLGLPWFQEGNLEKNLGLVGRVEAMAKEKGVTTAQMTLAWVLAQGEDFFAIPGTTKVKRLEENLGALEVVVSEEENQAVAKLAAEAAGLRLKPEHMEYNFADTPLEE